MRARYLQWNGHGAHSIKDFPLEISTRQKLSNSFYDYQIATSLVMSQQQTCRVSAEVCLDHLAGIRMRVKWYFYWKSNFLWKRYRNLTIHELHGALYHRQFDCFFKNHPWWQQRKHQSPTSLAHSDENPPVTDGFPTQRASNVKKVSMSRVVGEMGPFSIYVLNDGYTKTTRFSKR